MKCGQVLIERMEDKTGQIGERSAPADIALMVSGADRGQPVTTCARTQVVVGRAKKAVEIIPCADSWQHMWSGSRFHGIPLADIGDERYLPLLGTVIGHIYACGGIVYGGAVRDLLVGAAPVDIDVLLPIGAVTRFMALIQEGASAEAIHTQSSEACPGKRMRIYLEPGYVTSTAAMIVLDICSPLTFGCPIGGASRLASVLFDIPADYDVNMLYIESINVAGWTASSTITEMQLVQSEDGVDRIMTNWCTIRARYRVTNGMRDCSPGAYVVGCATIIRSLKSRVTRVAHNCDGVLTHIYLPSSLRCRRAASLTMAGFTDETVYDCRNINCRFCNVECLLAHATRILLRLAEDNLIIWQRSMENIILGTIRHTLIEKCNVLLKYCPYAMPCIDDSPICEWLLVSIDIAKVARACLSSSRPKIERIAPRSIEDTVYLKSAIGRGAISADCHVDYHISHYVDAAERMGREIIRRHVAVCNLLLGGEKMRTPSPPDERIG